MIMIMLCTMFDQMLFGQDGCEEPRNRYAGCRKDKGNYGRNRRIYPT